MIFARSALATVNRVVEALVRRLVALLATFKALRGRPDRIYSTAVGAVLLAFSILGLALSMLTGDGESSFVASATVVDTNSVELDVPTSVAAGRPIPITISGLQPEVPVEVTLEAGYGVRPLVLMPEGDTVEINVPPIMGPASGAAVITATQDVVRRHDGEEPARLANREADGDDANDGTGPGSEITTSTTRVATAVIEIEPGDAIDPLDAYLGPRTVIADGAHFVMIVTVPTDEFGNPVETGTPVDYKVTRADLAVEEQQAPTDHLLSWFEVFSSTVAGRTRIGAQVAGQGSLVEQAREANQASAGDQGQTGPTTAAERTFLEVAGIPVSHSLNLLDAVPVADGQALIRVRTSVLEDRFGNVLPDGTVVTLDADGVGGIRRLNSQANAGEAEFTYEVPDRPGSVTMKATASGVSGEPLTIRFESAVESFTADIEPQLDSVLVNVGPVLSVRDSYVPEGTIATVTMSDPDGDPVVRRVDLMLGAGTAFFPSDINSSEATVEVLGETLTIDGPRRDGAITSESLDGGP